MNKKCNLNGNITMMKAVYVTEGKQKLIKNIVDCAESPSITSNKS